MLQEIVWIFVKYLLIFAFAWTLITYLITPQRNFANIHSRWQTTFPFNFSTEEFYKLLRERIAGIGIDGIHTDLVTYSGTSALFSPNRLYLQVRRDDQMFLICAAPFGKEFFVSWWMGEPTNFVKDFIPRIPKLGPALAIWIYGKTFYRMDTDNMFNNCIRNCINEAIEHIANEHGVRNAREYMQQPTYIPSQGKLG